MLFEEIWRFNLATKSWKRLEIDKNKFPYQVASSVLEKVGGYFVIHGGSGIPFGMSNSNSTFLFSFVTNDFVKLKTSGDTPPPMYGQASAFDNESYRLYLVGGTTGHDFTMDVYCLDLVSMQWTKLSTPSYEDPPARYRCEVALYKGKLYVFGGGTNDENFDFDVSKINAQWGLIFNYPKNNYRQEQLPQSLHCSYVQHGCGQTVCAPRGCRIR